MRSAARGAQESLVFRISVNEHNHRPLSSPAHEDVRCFRAANGSCLKTRWQKRLRVTDRCADSKKNDDEKTSNHDSSAVSKLQIGNGLVQISAGMVEILLHSCKQRHDSRELQSV